jgi:hypothetical protein
MSRMKRDWNEHHKRGMGATRYPKGTVYLLRNCSTGLYKVGRAVDFTRRLAELGRRKYEVVHTIESTHTGQLEKHFIDMWWKKRASRTGEVFNLSEADVQFFVSFDGNTFDSNWEDYQI